MDILANFCPNIENFSLLFLPPDDDIIQGAGAPVASISSISFKKLTSLSLYGECELWDGAIMISVSFSRGIHIVN